MERDPTYPPTYPPINETISTYLAMTAASQQESAPQPSVASAEDLWDALGDFA